MKGVILHGGSGMRLRPLTYTGPKPLLPICNKPMSQYALENLRDVGISEIVIILGNVFPEKVREFYGDGKKFGVKITYIEQGDPKGISHAIRLTKDFINGEKFVVFLGDNVLKKGLTDYKKKFESDDSDAMILLCEVDNPSSFGIAELDGNQIKKIMEKPENPPSNLAVIGIYFLTPKIFDIIDNLKPSRRGEYEITDALQIMLENNLQITYDVVTGWWKDTGTTKDILHANKLILDTIGTSNQLMSGDLNSNNVVIGENTSISDDSIVSGPSIIGNNCKIGPSVKLGPYVSIGDNCVLQNCTIDESIIMNDCTINSKVNISYSIVAHGSKITSNEIPHKQQLILGEKSYLKL